MADRRKIKASGPKKSAPEKQATAPEVKKSEPGKPATAKVDKPKAAKIKSANTKSANTKSANTKSAKPELAKSKAGEPKEAKPKETKPVSAQEKPQSGKKAKSASKSSAPVIFDIKNPELPEVVEASAFESGGFPYPARYKRKKYNKKIVPLQIELLKMLDWAKKNGERIVVLFEGRDGAGKGGTITRFTQHLPPRQARIVALTKPSDAEKGQWYFQRYAAHMPTKGEIVFFDRSWYNRAGVERAMDFCTADETEEFLREAPAFEGMLVRDGIRLVKLFFSISREMQMKRLHDRFHDPLKVWKLSPIDFEAIPRFDAYSSAFNTLLARTHTERAPWTIIRSNDKLRARLNALRHVLLSVPYEGKDIAAIGEIDEKIVMNAPDYLNEGGER